MYFESRDNTPYLQSGSHAVGRPLATLVETPTNALVGSFDYRMINSEYTWCTIMYDEGRCIGYFNSGLTIDLTAVWRTVEWLHVEGKYTDEEKAMCYDVINLACHGFAFDDTWRAPLLSSHSTSPITNVRGFFAQVARVYGTLLRQDLFYVPNDFEMDDFSAITDVTYDSADWPESLFENLNDDWMAELGYE